MAEQDTGVDAAKAAIVARQHAIMVSGNLAAHTFKLISVEPNTIEGIWKVVCEYLSRPADEQPSRYLIKVNINKGTVENIGSEK